MALPGSRIVDKASASPKNGFGCERKTQDGLITSTMKQGVFLYMIEGVVLIGTQHSRIRRGFLAMSTPAIVQQSVSVYGGNGGFKAICLPAQPQNFSAIS